MGLHCLVFEICIKSTITGEYQGSVGSCPQVLHVRFSLVLDLTNRLGGGWVCLWEIGQWKWYIIGLMFLRVLALITAVWSFFMQYNYDQRVSWQFILVSKYGKNSTPIPGLLQNFHKSETFSDTCNSMPSVKTPKACCANHPQQDFDVCLLPKRTNYFKKIISRHYLSTDIVC